MDRKKEIKKAGEKKDGREGKKREKEFKKAR